MSVFFALHVHEDILIYIYVVVMLVGMWALRNLSDGAVNVFKFESKIYLSKSALLPTILPYFQCFV